MHAQTICQSSIKSVAKSDVAFEEMSSLSGRVRGNVYNWCRSKSEQTSKLDSCQKNIDRVAMNSCARVAFEVIKDKKVQDSFVELINQEYIFDRLNEVVIAS
jgi:hypothetical protein